MEAVQYYILEENVEVFNDEDGNEETTAETMEIFSIESEASEIKSKKIVKKALHERHPCQVCGETFSVPYTLQIHMRLHTGERPYKCQHCPKAFTMKGDRDSHERIHTGEKPYTCKVCEKSFRTSGMVKVHMRTHTGERAFNCKDCGEMFFYYHQLRTHFKEMGHSNVTDDKWKCDECGLNFGGVHYLEMHRRSHLKKSDDFPMKTKYTRGPRGRNNLKGNVNMPKLPNANRQIPICTICQRSFRSLAGLVKHKIELHKDVSALECIACSVSFSTTMELKAHLGTSEHAEECGSTEPDFWCDICEKNLSGITSYNLHTKFAKEHMINVLRKKMAAEQPVLLDEVLPCKLCAEQFSSNYLLLEHNVTIHKDVHQFFCEVCVEFFPSLKSYKEHNLNLHKDLHKYRCSKCPKIYRTRAELSNHQKIHSAAGKTCLCDICGKCFASKLTLRKHLTMSKCNVSLEGNSCEVCDMTFPSLAALKHHKVRHRSFKFACSYCDKKFPVIHMLDRHKKSHLNNNSENITELSKCIYCDQKFSRIAMKSHLLIHFDVGFKLNCQKCTKAVTSKPELYDHVRQAHGIEVPFPCEICYSVFASLEEVRKHEVKHNLKLCCKFSCVKCDHLFSVGFLIKEHRLLHSELEKEDSTLSVVNSEKTSGNESLFVTVVDSSEQDGINNETICIEIKEEVMDDSPQVESCMPVNRSISQVHKCSLCHALMTNNNVIINAHENLHNEKMPHQCKKCGRSFMWKVTLCKHQKRSRDCGNHNIKRKKRGKTGTVTRAKLSSKSRDKCNKKSAVSHKLKQSTFSCPYCLNDEQFSKKMLMQHMTTCPEWKVGPSSENDLSLAENNSEQTDDNRCNVEQKMQLLTSSTDDFAAQMETSILSNTSEESCSLSSSFHCIYCKDIFSCKLNFEKHPCYYLVKCEICLNNIPKDRLMLHQLDHLKGQDPAKCNGCKLPFALKFAFNDDVLKQFEDVLKRKLVSEEASSKQKSSAQLVRCSKRKRKRSMKK